MSGNISALIGKNAIDDEEEEVQPMPKDIMVDGAGTFGLDHQETGGLAANMMGGDHSQQMADAANFQWMIDALLQKFDQIEQNQKNLFDATMSRLDEVEKRIEART